MYHFKVEIGIGVDFSRLDAVQLAYTYYYTGLTLLFYRPSRALASIVVNLYSRLVISFISY